MYTTDALVRNGGSGGGVVGGGGEHDICKHVCGVKLDLINVSIVKSLWLDLK